MVLGLAEHAEPGRLLAVPAIPAVLVPAGLAFSRGLVTALAAGPVLAGGVIAGDGVAVLVPQDWLVLDLHLEVGGGGVEEQQVHLQVQQARDPVEDLPLQGVPDFQEPVHRPVAGVVGSGGQLVDVRLAAGPVRRGELGGRVQRPVRDQREQHPLRHRVPAGPGQRRGHDLADPQPLPQLVQQVRAAEGDRAGVGQLRGRPGRVLVLAEQAAQRPGQPLHRGPVQLILPAEAVHHPHPRGLRRRVPLVLDQLHVADGAAVLVPPRRGAHEHVTRLYRSVAARKVFRVQIVSLWHLVPRHQLCHPDLQTHP